MRAWSSPRKPRSQACASHRRNRQRPPEPAPRGKRFQYFASYDFPRTVSAAPKPDDGAGNDHKSGQKDHAGEKQLALLRFRKNYAPVGRIFGPNGNEIFILRQPIDRVHKKVAIALQARPLIGGKGGIADDHEPRVLTARTRAAMAFRGYAERERSGLVFGWIIADFLGVQVRNGEASRRSLEQLGALRVALALIFQRNRARQIEKRHRSGEILSDGAGAVIHDKRNGGPGAEEPADAARIDHHVAAQSDIPSVEDAIHFGIRFGIEQKQNSAAAVEILGDKTGLLREERLLRPGVHQDAAIGGHFAGRN